MLKDLQDPNKSIIAMFRGTDSRHEFYVVNSDGSSFIYSDYNIVGEGRVSPKSESPQFSFPFETFTLDSVLYGRVKFPATIVTNSVRESKIYFRVVATSIATGESIVIQNGEIWLQE